MANLSKLQDELKTNIVRVQEQYQRNADHNRVEALDLKIGDWVYSKAKYFWMGCPSKKLRKEPGTI